MNAALAVAAAALLAGSSAAPRRWVLVIANNRGEGSEETLRYAEADARRFLAVMEEVGGVAPADASAVLGGSAADVGAALSALQARISMQGTPNDQLVVYVSSHADDEQLHLAGTRLPLRDLSAFVARAPVGVAALIVDSCRSGALARTKGLKPAEPVQVTLVQPEVTGRVIISSSGADEYSQESDALGGSYFTHHLIAGLRGVADTSGDGRVTLQEAYAYAYARTIESTFATRGGVQHPSFAVDLQGRGELVLTDVGRATARLRIEDPEAASWLVANVDGAEIVAQFDKPAGPCVLALRPGEYKVQRRAAGRVQETSVQVGAAGATVSPAQLRNVPLAFASLKGTPSASLVARLGGAIGTGAVAGAAPLLGGQARLELQDAPWPVVNVLSLGLGYQVGRVQGASEIDLALGAAAALSLGGIQYEIPGTDFVLRGFRVELGFEAGFTFVEPLRQFSPHADVRLGAAGRILGPVSWYLAGTAGAVHVKRLDGTSDLGWTACLTGGLGFRL